MWQSQSLLEFRFPTKITFPGQKVVANRVMKNPTNTQTIKSKLPKCPSNRTVNQQMIPSLQITLAHKASIHQNFTPSLQVVASQNFTMHRFPHKERNLSGS
uniref:Uncharacterized protein n=1 Tax=Opuntia streptacantha TaxID=393608 RepID=A0A7C9FH22_OPUST